MAIQKLNIKGVMHYRVSRRYSNGVWESVGPFTCAHAAAFEEEKMNKKPDFNILTSNTSFESVSIFFKHWQKHHREKVSEGWRISQDQMWRDYCENVIGSLPIHEVKENDIAFILTSAIQLGRGDQTICHIFNLVHKVFSVAKDKYKIINENPCKSHLKAASPKGKISKFLDQSQFEKVLGLLIGHWGEVFFTVGFYTGLRVSEIQELRWKDIDFERKVIFKQRCFNRKTKKIQAYPKEKKHSIVPIPGRLLILLKRRASQPDDLVCKGPKGGRIVHTKVLQLLRNICNQAEVPVITLHEMRHSTSELFVSKGASAEDVRRLLGHSSVKTTQRYLHSENIERVQAIAGKL